MNSTIETARRIADTVRVQGGKAVYTNGCFDVIHAGHVHWLTEAHRFGTHLIVGLNSDDSIRRLKGPGRPVFSLTDRLDMLTALRVVGTVVVFDGDNCADVIEAVRPDVFVTPEPGNAVEVAMAARRGIGIVFVKRSAFPSPDQSTTSLVERLRNVSP